MRAILALIVLIVIGAAAASASETVNYAYDARGFATAATIEAPPVAAGFAITSETAAIISAGATAASGFVSFSQGDYYGAVGSFAAAFVGTKGVAGIERLARINNVSIKPASSKAIATVGAQAISRGLVCSR